MQRRAAEESLTDHGKDNSNGRAHVGDAIRHKPGILGFLRQIGFMGATAQWCPRDRGHGYPYLGMLHGRRGVRNAGRRAGTAILPSILQVLRSSHGRDRHRAGEAHCQPALVTIRYKSQKLWSARAGGSLHPRVTAQAFARATDRRIHYCSSRRPMS